MVVVKGPVVGIREEIHLFDAAISCAILQGDLAVMIMHTGITFRCFSFTCPRENEDFRSGGTPHQRGGGGVKGENELPEGVKIEQKCVRRVHRSFIIFAIFMLLISSDFV